MTVRVFTREGALVPMFKDRLVTEDLSSAILRHGWKQVAPRWTPRWVASWEARKWRVYDLGSCDSKQGSVLNTVVKSGWLGKPHPSHKRLPNFDAVVVYLAHKGAIECRS